MIVRMQFLVKYVGISVLHETSVCVYKFVYIFLAHFRYADVMINISFI